MQLRKPKSSEELMVQQEKHEQKLRQEHELFEQQLKFQKHSYQLWRKILLEILVQSKQGHTASPPPPTHH